MNAQPQSTPSSRNPLLILGNPIFLVIAIGLITAFLLLTLRKGQEWEGDDALYILNARNIVLGIPYAKTGYIVNPDNLINPAAYPPGFPLLIAPIYWLFGVSLVKIKMLCIACFAMFLGIFARIARDCLSPGAVLALTVAIGLHPYIWNFSNSIYSELPFMLACYGALFLIDRLQRSSEWQPLSIAGAALLVAAAYLTRSVGIILFPAAVCSALFVRRRSIGQTLVTLVVAGAIAFLVGRIFQADVGTYVSYFKGFGIHSVISALAHYARIGGALFGHLPPRIPALAAVLGLGFAGFAVFGFLVTVRRQISIFEWFFVGYGVFLLIYPISEEPSRYSLPLWPLLFLYFAQGIRSYVRTLRESVRYKMLAAVFVVIAGLYLAEYATADFGPIPHSVDAAESVALFSAIRADVAPGATILARKPTVIALYCDRKATVWDDAGGTEALWRLMRRQHVGFIVQERFPVVNHAEDQNALLNTFIERNRSALTPVFANAWFVLYEVTERQGGTKARSGEARNTAESG